MISTHTRGRISSLPSIGHTYTIQIQYLPSCVQYEITQGRDQGAKAIKALLSEMNEEKGENVKEHSDKPFACLRGALYRVYTEVKPSYNIFTASSQRENSAISCAKNVNISRFYTSMLLSKRKRPDQHQKHLYKKASVEQMSKNHTIFTIF